MKSCKVYLFFIVLSGIAGLLNAQGARYVYSVPNIPWEESLGNHRAILQIDESSEVFTLDFDWRRPDRNIDETCFLILHAETGDTVQNIKRVDVSAEKCKLMFGPAVKGLYYFYYLPYKVVHGYGAYNGDYIAKEKAPDSVWLTEIDRVKDIPQALVTKVESRTKFDSFYPMEVTATGIEKEQYMKKYRTPLYLFSEDRTNPIRMRDHLPLKWMDQPQGQVFRGMAAPNEYYTFQIGLWAGRGEVNKISYKASALQCGAERIPQQAITCFNVEGIDPYGKEFRKEVNVGKGYVQPLWFGIDVPAGQKAGLYQGTIVISDESGRKGVVPLSIRIEGEPLADRGDSELWRHSRLRWLNSTLGISDMPTQPYASMTVKELHPWRNPYVLPLCNQYNEAR